MDSDKKKKDGKPGLLTNVTLDTSGVWFVGVALFAVVAAAILVYRTADRLAF
jgi:hypothetical protein